MTSGLRAIALLGIAVPARASYDSVKADLLAAFASAPFATTTRPGKSPLGDGTADLVEAQIYIDRFLPLEQQTRTYGFQGYMRLWWTDPRLEFNATEAGADSIKLEGSEMDAIWLPTDVYWDESLTVKASGGEAGALFVYPSGLVWWSRQMSFEMMCRDMSFHDFPYDTHRCPFLMGLYSYTATDLVLKWKDGETALANWDASAGPGACMVEWTVTAMEQENVAKEWPSGTYTYADATVQFTRNHGSYLANYFVPALMLCFTGFGAFFIDPAAVPARVALGIILILVVLTNYISMQKQLPVGVSGSWISEFLFGSMIFNFFAFWELVAVNLGMSAYKWLTEQRKLLQGQVDWAKELLKNSDYLVSYLELWDKDKSGSVDKHEFRKGVDRLKLGVPHAASDIIFAELDADHSGTVTVEEILERFAKETPASPVSPAPVQVSVEQVGPSAPSPGAKTRATSLKRSNTLKNAVKQQKKEIHRTARVELEQGAIWEFKVFYLFPALQYVRNLDHIARFLFPLAYLIFVIAHMSQINFGNDHVKLMTDAQAASPDSKCFGNLNYYGAAT